MLIEFGMENFRTFKDNTVFSMEKGAKKDLNDTIIETKLNHLLLPNKVIYGDNASGKTTIVLAMKLLKTIIIEGETENLERGNIINNIPIYHFIHDEESFFNPIKLYINYINDEKEFYYELHLKNFKESTRIKNKIIFEKLDIDKINLFERKGKNIKFNKNIKNKEKVFMQNLDDDYLDKMEKILESNDIDNQIFTSWFNINDELVKNVKSWFEKKIEVFLGLENIEYNIKIDENEDASEIKLVNKYILKLIKQADFGPQVISFRAHKMLDGKYKTNINSEYVIKSKDDKNKPAIIDTDSRISESLGTLKLLKFIFPFVNSILNGTVLIVDELDSSIHPEIIAGIIKVFSDKRINDKGAQLIFTTHNPMFLNNNLFRRDEIVFVEKDQYNYSSSINTLDDFDIRSDERYLKNYLEGKYVIFSNIDFGKIIQEIKENS